MKKIFTTWMVFSVIGLSLAMAPAKGNAGDAKPDAGVKSAAEVKPAAVAGAKTGEVKVTASLKPGAAPENEITIAGEKPAHFNHSTHMGLGLTCGTCHHDAKHQPLKPEAVTQAAADGKLHCITCHNDVFANEKLRERKNVFHTRCQECHKQGVNGKMGPTKCADCHITQQKKKLEGC